MTNLFNTANKSKKMYCNVYHDERKIPSKWLYHGFLFIPCDKKSVVLELLNVARAKSTWDCVLHFHDLRNTLTENKLAELWTNLFCFDFREITFFYYIGIDYTKLAKKLWLGCRRDKIYNRFFQIGLYGAIKWFFLNKEAGYNEVTVNKIFSHAKTRYKKDRFRTQPIEDITFKSMIKNEKINFEYPQIIEIADDHREESEYSEKSHIIQYVDLIIGGLSQIFDCTSQHIGKCIVADRLCGNNLPTEIIYYDMPKFKSNYYKKYAISFFPKEKVSEKDILQNNIITAKNQFYHSRELKYLAKFQYALFNGD